MQLVKTLSPKGQIKNSYQIIMDTYWGDADGTDSYKLLVPQEDIFRVILEIIVLSQFWPNGRGGGGGADTKAKSFLVEEGANSDKFDWLEDYPYNHDCEQENTLNYYKIFYYDENAMRYKIQPVGFEEFTKEFEEFNKAQQMGDYKKWRGLKVGAPEFINYRVGIYALIDKFLLELNLGKALDNKESPKLKI